MARRRICIDGFNLDMAKGSGIATYARNLGATLKKIGFQTELLHGPRREPGSNNLINEVALFDAVQIKGPRPTIREFLRKRAKPPHRDAKRIELTGLVDARQMGAGDFGAEVHWSCRDVFGVANRDFAAHGRFTEVSFASEGVRAPPDAAHWTCVLPLRAPKAFNIYTIHDVVPLKLPFATLDDKPRFFELCKNICRDADHVITVSEKSRQDIIDIFGISEDRITNTYQCVTFSSALLRADDQEVAAEVESTFNLGWKDYYLFFGAVEPKKNLARTIEAYLSAGVKAPLVIIGGRAWLDEDETRMIENQRLQIQIVEGGVLQRNDRIRRYDYLSAASLVSVIRGAKATLFPSLYEGFGLPILESMLLGTPVLTSTAGASAEIAGEAALLVDPYDTRAIKRAIQALDCDEGLRLDLSRRGSDQAAKFSPEAYEQRLDDLYRKLF